MNQRLFSAALAIGLLALLANSAHALVMIRYMKAGEIPNYCPADIKEAMGKVKSIEGIEHDGFGWVSARLYCRGTHNDIQALLDALVQSESINLKVAFDQSGKPGIIKPRKNSPQQRTRWYVYQVTIGKQNIQREGEKPLPVSVQITIHSVGGVRPGDLQIPAEHLISEAKP